MRITIDTKEDSHEEIRKVIKMLSHLVESSQEQRNIFENDDTPTTNALGAMFGDDDTPTTLSEETTEENGDAPEVIEY